MKPTKHPDDKTSSFLSKLGGQLSPATLDALAQYQSAHGIEKPAEKVDREKLNDDMPPRERLDIKTLSMLAAVASQGTAKTPSEAVAYAWDLWEASKDVLQYGSPVVLLLRKPDPIEQHWKEAGCFPKRFPVKLDEFLRLMLPRLIGRTGEMHGVFRAYLDFRLRNPSPPGEYWDDKPLRRIPPNRIPFDCCHPRIVPATSEPFPSLTSDNKPGKPPEPTKEDVEKRFALWRANPIPDRNSFYYHADHFRSWYDITHTATIREKRRTAGAKGLASEKRNKNKSEADSHKPDKRKGARPPRDRLRQAVESAVGGLDTILPPKKP
jgi:hypothetical protein